MKNIDTIVISGKCTGCGSCQAICGKKAIHIELNVSGFYESNIDKTKCVNCGLCAEVCPALVNVPNNRLKDAEMYAVQAAAPEVLVTCSSGGVAHVLSEKAIGRGYSVVGAVYDFSKNRVAHKIAKNCNQIKEFDGSKYLQSYTAEAFSAAVEEAKRNREAYFLVVGTPCQITGLANLTNLLGIRKQFVLIEFFCHGVPTYSLWEEELRQLSHKLRGESIQAIRFRSKKLGWHNFCMECSSKHHTVCRRRETDLFWNAYFENMLLNRCCYSCEYKGEQTRADIRIGDYWGEAFEKRRDGVSLVFACSPVGKEWLAQCIAEKKIILLKNTDYDEAILPQEMESNYTALHGKVQDMLKARIPITTVISVYRKQQGFKKKLKRCVLSSSTLIPLKVQNALRAVYRRVFIYK